MKKRGRGGRGMRTQLHDNYLTATERRPEYSKQHLYMKQTKRNAMHFAKQVFTTQDELPGKQSMPRKDQDRLGKLYLITHGVNRENSEEIKNFTPLHVQTSLRPNNAPKSTGAKMPM